MVWHYYFSKGKNVALVTFLPLNRVIEQGIKIAPWHIFIPYFPVKGVRMGLKPHSYSLVLFHVEGCDIEQIDLLIFVIDKTKIFNSTIDEIWKHISVSLFTEVIDANVR